MPKAYSYIRFSTPEQASGDSFRRQTELAQNFCATNGLTLADGAEYTFFDRGLSAYKAKHLDDEGQLKRFLDYVDEGKIEPGSWLLVESLDRLSREKVSIALPRFLDLINKGITVATLADGRTYSAGANEMDLIISIVHMSRAHEESRIKGQRVSAAWKRKKELARTELKPLTPKAPAWIRLSGGKFELIEEKAAIVRRMFDLTINGRGAQSIVSMFNVENVPVISERKRNGPLLWSISPTKKILQSRTVLGEYQPGKRENGKQINDGPPIAGYYPPVIDEATFYAAQAAISGRRVTKATKQSKRFNVWQGIARCFWCGGPMHLVTKGGGRGGQYLRCYTSARRGPCSSKSIRLDRTEQAFREILSKVDSLSLVQDSSKAIQKALDVATGKLSALEARLTAAEAAYAEVPTSAGARVLKQFEEDQRALQSQIEELRQQLASSTITDKEEFFSRLDLESYEGRNAANRLMKRLGLLVYIDHSVDSILEPGQVGYSLWRADAPPPCSDEDGGTQEGLQLDLVQNADGTFDAWSDDDDVLERQYQQGEISKQLRDMWKPSTFGLPDPAEDDESHRGIKN